MKLFYCFILSLFLSIAVYAQTSRGSKSSIPVITINARLIGKDSVIIPYDNNYIVVQDACMQIIRYGHYSFSKKAFFGKFKDVKAGDSTMMIAEGNFSKNGLKDGAFVLHYLDGQLEAKGNFIEDKYDGDWVFYYPNGKIKSKGSFNQNKYVGKWEMYYEDGRPQLFFEDENRMCKIANSWRPDGTKMINDGNGDYQSDINPHWVGKLRNGLPDGNWTCKLSFDSSTYVVEQFTNNQFLKGDSKSGSFSRHYEDKSSISLFPQLPLLKIDHSQFIDVNPSCNGVEYSEAYVKMFNTTYLNKDINMHSLKFYKDEHN